jgi:transposase InsO family protein
MAHRNARLTVCGRVLLCRRVVEEGWTLREAASACGVSRQTAAKWLARWRRGETLHDRSSRPLRIRHRLGTEQVRRVVALRLRLRLGPARIAFALQLAATTVWRQLKRLGLSRLRRLRPQPPVRRYCWPAAGDLLHLDTKKLGRIGEGGGKWVDLALKGRHRGIGWNWVHVAVDDHSRLAYAEELPDELAATTVGFLERALVYFAGHGIHVQRLLTDNGVPYRAHGFRRAVEDHGLRHLRTRPYRPQSNGKAEAFIKILLSGWAYRRPYDSGAEREAALGQFLLYYNHYRHHSGLGGARPIERLTTPTTS